MIWAQPISSEPTPLPAHSLLLPRLGDPVLSQGSGSSPLLSEVGAPEGAASWVGRPGVAPFPSSPTFHSFALTLRYECHLGPGPWPL